ncbi:MAG: amidase [Planctomycetota bacterium]
MGVSDEIERLCARLDEVDGELRAFLPEPDRRGRLQREHGDEPRRRGPVLAVKDIFRVDGFETRAGSSLPPHELAGDEAECVRRFRAAGAWVLGKTHTTEFAMLDPGPTRNPHDHARTPGGSSSGSAAAVSAGLAEVALGSQTVGSVLRPAAYCGVVGFKPTFDRVPTAGVLYCSPSVDHVGLFARDVATMTSAARTACLGWTQAAERGTAPRMLVPDGPYLEQQPDDGRAEFEQRLDRLVARGVELERVPCMDDFEALAHRHSRLVAYEFAREHQRLYELYGERYRDCARNLVVTGRDVGEAEADEARASCVELRSRLERLLDEHRADLWVSPPAMGTAPVGLEATGSPAMNLPWTHAGLPTLGLPAGPGADGMPLGLQLSARFGRDEELLAAAAWLEPRALA